MKETNRLSFRRIAALLLALLLAAALLPPLCAQAQASGRVVRVGWFESSFNMTDELGRRTGYGYEYQQKIAAYTGWTYEYVEESWPELMQKLQDGNIDLLCDVSYTEERAERMLFSSRPMGTEEYFLFVSVKNSEISPEDYSTLNGKRVGVNKGSVQIDYFLEWAEANGVEAQLVELTGSESENIDCLLLGEIDAYISMDTFSRSQRVMPICQIGSSEFYFAVSLACPELLPELNAALDRIQNENRYYNQQLYEKYIQSSAVNLFLSGEEREWLANHGTLRVGYQDNYLAFCAKDPKTGELTGALKEYLRVAEDCLENAHLDIEAYAFPTAATAMEAMKRGEVDCVFPANLTDYDGEVQGYFITPAIMRTDMSAVIRESDRETFGKEERVTVAVNVGNPNYDMFLLDHFPEWRSIYYKDTPECLKAIADGQADCLLISNYRYNNIAALCQKYKLVTLSTGVEMDYCFAVDRQDLTLYSILSKVNRAVPEATVNSALSYYFTEDAKISFWEQLLEHLDLVVLVLAAVILGFLLLLLRNARTEKKVSAGQELISATETDELTGLYNRNYFFQYAERMYREQPDRPMDAIVLNIEQFHSVNALKGRSFGDQTLQVLGNELLSYLKEKGGIGSREESDQFAVYCPHEEDSRPLFNRLQGALDNLSPNSSIRLRMGVMPWQKDTEPLHMVEQARFACGLTRVSADHLVVFDEKIRERASFEHRLLNDLDHAVEDRQFVVYYQPKYDIRTEPPKLVSAEALVRWQHPELGMIAPDHFIPLLERSGEITAVDRFVWEEAARQVAAWRSKWGRTVPVSVNLSREDVIDPALEVVLDALVQENGLTQGDLKLEITETVCGENGSRILSVVERLRKRGYEIELDDFGTGYSSLSILSSLPVDVLKMDRGFVSHMEHNEKDLQLVELILGIARNMKIPVVAEGVETEVQLRLLKELGCDLVQGYYFSRPLPAREFEAVILGEAAQ